MVRAPCCDKKGLKRGPWTPAEDQLLITYIQNYGHENWRALPKHAGLLRCGKSCRLRWMNYLRPDIKRGNFSREEEDTIIELHEMLGNRWSAIAARLPGRTDNEIKNVWHTYIKKRKPQAAQNQNLTAELSPSARDSSENAMSENSESSSQEQSSGESSAAGATEESPTVPPINDSFWSDSIVWEPDFPVEALEFLRFPCSPVRTVGPSGCEYSSCSDSGDDMGFWYNLFRAGTLPAELPEF